MHKLSYWAVRPKSYDTSYTRIEKAASAREAARLAFGVRLLPPGHAYAHLDRGKWIAKNLGSSVAILRSANKRIAALNDPNGWVDAAAN